MRKAMFTFALMATSLAMMPQTAQAQSEKQSAELAKEAAVFEKLLSIFDTGDAEPIDEQRLALARTTTGKILPDGTYGRMMEKTFDQFVVPMAGLFARTDLEAISAATGVDQLALSDLDEDASQRVSELLDPHAEKRGTATLDLMIPLMKDAFTEIEPALREGMARAYARKFSAKQLTELNAFFETPTGSLYASESFVLMADPEIMSASMQALPAIMEKIFTAVPTLEEGLKDIPEPRTLADLSADELSELAGLLSVDVSDLEAFRDNPPQDEETEE